MTLTSRWKELQNHQQTVLWLVFLTSKTRANGDQQVEMGFIEVDRPLGLSSGIKDSETAKTGDAGEAFWEE